MASLARFTSALVLLLSSTLSIPAAAAEDGANGTQPDEPAIASLPQYLADLTRSAAEELVAQLSAVVEALGPAEDGGQPIDWDRVGSLVAELAIVVVATIVLFFLLRRLSRVPQRWLGEWSERGERRVAIVRRLVAVLGAAALNGIAIVVAWVAGYALALYATGTDGQMSPSQSLFLNAFLGIEVLKVLVRVVFGSGHGGVRLFPLADRDAAYWDARLARLVDFGGYGLLFVVPVTETQVAPVAGAVLSLLVLLVALLYVFVIIRQNRQVVRGKLEAKAAASRFGSTRALLTVLARVWHWLAIVYFVALAIAIQTRPEDVLPFMALATLQSLIALALGLVLYNFLSGLLGRRVRVPESAARHLPQLEQRVNGFVAPLVHVLRAAVAIALVATLLDAWSLFDLDAWLGSAAGTALLATVASVGFIVLVAILVWIAFTSWIDRRLGAGEGPASSRERTLLTLFRNAAAIVLIVMTVMISLSEIGIEIGPLLAGAGVLGLAIGFGAQSLVQDIITGVFIQLENAINTDDVITVAGITGVVERLSIRSVGVRDLAGTFHIVPFSQVSTVSNFMRGYAYHVGEYGIAYREDVNEALSCLQAAFDDLRADPEMGPAVLDELEIHGVTALADSSVKVRVRVKTEPGMQWAVGRAYNLLVKQHLDAAGIEIPFPHMTLYFGQNKDGSAPPAQVQWIEPGAGGESKTG